MTKEQQEARAAKIAEIAKQLIDALKEGSSSQNVAKSILEENSSETTKSVFNQLSGFHEKLAPIKDKIIEEKEVVIYAIAFSPKKGIAAELQVGCLHCILKGIENSNILNQLGNE